MITTVLFDLDGTLLPMNQDEFNKAYFKGLVTKAAPYGYNPEELIASVWKGVKAMVLNDGAVPNEQVFWKCFAEIHGQERLKDKLIFDEYYRDDFDGLKSACGFNPKAAEAVKQIKEAGFNVALATNPIFPAVATECRIRWTGLSPDDFSLYTTYENCGYCKPNPEYYRDICAKLKVLPEECLMVGNDAVEDTAAAKAGLSVFMLTDHLINSEGCDISKFPSGGFDDLISYIGI